MKKILLIFISTLMFSQDFIPENGETLNYTQIFFKWPQINNSYLYQLNFNGESTEYESYENSIIIDNLQWDEDYSWSVCGLTESNNIIDCYNEMNFYIESLPSDYPENVNILELNESEYSPGFTLLDYESLNYSVVLNQGGEAVWFSDKNNFDNSKILATQFLSNGNIVGFSPGTGYEFNLDNDIIFETSHDFDIHHYIHKTENDTYFFIDADTENHPCPSECEPEYPNIIPWQGDKFVEVDQAGNVLWEWSTFDYLSLDEYNPYWVQFFMDQWDFGGNPSFDWTHSNSVYFDSEQGIVYISIRNLSRIVAIDYSTKQILWNMGNSEFMEQVFFEDDFGFSHQHSAQITSNKNILFFDNGRDNNPELSRCIEIEVDDSYENAELVWEHILPESMVTLSRGECDRLPNGNTLISIGRTGNVLEVNNENEIVWHLNVTEDNGLSVTIYRSERILNLYPNAFSFNVNNLFGSYNDNYHISYDDNSIEFEIYNKGWANQTFVYELFDINQNLIGGGQINISAYNYEIANIPIMDPLIENYILKVYPINNENNYQSIIFDNNFMMGDLNGDSQLDILDIISLVNITIYDEDYLEQGDLNNDGGINILDIIIIIDWILD